MLLLGLLGCGGGTPGPTGAVEGFVYYIDPGDANRTIRPVALATVDGIHLAVSGATVATSAGTATTDAQGRFHVVAPSGQAAVTIVHAQFREPLAASAAVTANETTALGGVEMPVTFGVGVGVGRYQAIEPWLDAPPKDVARIAAALFTPYKGATTLLIDGQATREGIRRAVQDTAARVRPGDRLVFYYSGHGTSHALAQSEGDPQLAGWHDVLVPFDSDPQSYIRDISDADLRDWLATMPDPKQAVVIIDSCGAGAFFDGMASTRTAQTRALRASGCTVIAASAPNESSWETADTGVFTYYLNAALTTQRSAADLNRDRNLTAAEAFDYAARGATAAKPEQHPTLQAGSNPVLLRW
jgi:hypothetical protein